MKFFTMDDMIAAQKQRHEDAVKARSEKTRCPTDMHPVHLCRQATIGLPLSVSALRKWLNDPTDRRTPEQVLEDAS